MHRVREEQSSRTTNSRRRVNTHTHTRGERWLFTWSIIGTISTPALAGFCACGAAQIRLSGSTTSLSIRPFAKAHTQRVQSDTSVEVDRLQRVDSNPTGERGEKKTLDEFLTYRNLFIRLRKKQRTEMMDLQYGQSSSSPG